MDRREAAQHKLHFLALLAEKVRAEMANDTPYTVMGFAELQPDDALRQPEKFCHRCGVASPQASKFCPDCGAPSKRLEAHLANSRVSESGSIIALPTGPTLVGRLNVAGLTVEIFDDGSVIVLTPYAVSMAVVKLGAADMGDYQTRLAPIENVRKAAAPTSTI